MKIGAFDVKDTVPEMRNTCAIAMLRPWIDVGRVGTLVLNRLERHLGAQELGRLDRPGNYYDFTRYRPRTRIVEGQRVLTVPNSIVHYAHDEGTERDYLFLHLREPHSMGEDYTDAIVTLLKHFDVTEYCRIGGMYDSVPHTRPVLVTGSLSPDQEDKAAGLVSPRRSTYQGPTSIVNLVTENMTSAEIATPSLMAHLPQYVQLDEDHMGAARLMEVLCSMYGFSSSLADTRRGEKQYQDISRAVENNAEVKALIQQLESYYDRVLAGQQGSQEQEQDVSLAPDIENFLREVGQRFEGQGDGGNEANGGQGESEDGDGESEEDKE